MDLKQRKPLPREQLKTIGNCRLCGQKRELVDSHVWPKFAYKYFAANQATGGSFIDLSRQCQHNRQYTRSWFCHPCDSQTLSAVERYAALLCRRLDRRAATFRYDERLARFCASISWRTAINGLETDAKLGPSVRPACRQWREYLRDQRSTVGMYSQHLFVVFSPTAEMHRALGGMVFPQQDVVLSQIGPLFIVGLLRQEPIRLKDLKIWDESRVFESGGVVTPITRWHVGQNITMRFAKFMARHERSLVRQILGMADAGRI